MSYQQQDRANTKDKRRERTVAIRCDQETFARVEHIQRKLAEKIGARGVTLSTVLNYCITVGAKEIG